MEKAERQNWLKILLPLILAVVLSAGFFLGHHLSSRKHIISFGQSSFRTHEGGYIDNILDFVIDSYVDTVDRLELSEAAIEGILKQLDPHSAFIPARDLNERIDPLTGSFEGIGIEFNIMSDTVLVISTMASGPSEKAGMMAGDRIVEVDGKVIAGVGMPSNEVVRMLKGPKGTEVHLVLLRRSIEEPVSITIVRDKIPQYSLDIAYMLSDEIGYIKLNRFSASSHREFKTGLDKLIIEGMQKLILDLRGNTGGYLDAAIQIADELIDGEKLIVYTEGRRWNKQVTESTKGGLFPESPVVILIDEWSASASEIVAGAIQDNDRGVVVGRRSFGKGLVQEQVFLNDGSALLLTVARYYTPSGRSIQKPYDNGLEQYYHDILSALTEEENALEQIADTTSLQYETTGGRIVFGGGGIMPDVLLPVETGERFVFLNQLVNRGLFYRFAFENSEETHKELRGPKTARSFWTTFLLPERTYASFLLFAKMHGVEVPSRIEPDVEAIIKNSIKAYLGRVIFGTEAFFPVINQNDRAVQKAIEVLESSRYIELLRPFL